MSPSDSEVGTACPRLEPDPSPDPLSPVFPAPLAALAAAWQDGETDWVLDADT